MDRTERAVSYAEITELLSRYALVIDRRQWDSLDEIFTHDATFDATAVGYEFLDGLLDIKRHMTTDARHPVAHLLMNISATIERDRAQVTSRLLALQDDGRVFVGEYQDTMVRSQTGWRIRTRLYARLSERTRAGVQEASV